MEERPYWTHWPPIWTEDECAPDRERLGEAWLRIFGEPLPEKRIAVWDGGDAFGYLYEKGRVAWDTYMGGEIAIDPEALLAPHEDG